MTGAARESSTLLEDSRNSDIPSCSKLFEKFRQRSYGVLLHEKPRHSQDEIFVPEWCMTGPGSLDKVVMQRVENPPDCHPGLEILWAKEDRSADNVR